MQKCIVLTFDDAVANHRSHVVPRLLEYGFGATFFITRSGKWLEEHPECYLTWKEIREIAEAGFEIGNHTVNHISLSNADEATGRREVSGLNDLFAAEGIPAPVSFAYPGGPYAEKAAQWLGEYGLRCARTTGKTLWTAKSDPMNVGSWAISAGAEGHLQDALSKLAAAGGSGPCAAVLTYHGVPDIAHPWCDTPPEMFEKHMKTLQDTGYPVLSMKDFLLMTEENS